MFRVMMVAASLMMMIAAEGAAQWRLGLEAGADRVVRFAEAAGEAGGRPRVRPELAWPLAARLERGGAGLRLALSASRVAAGLELDDGEFAVVVRPGFRILSLAPELSQPVLSLSSGGHLRVHLALPLERWSFPGLSNDPRWRAGAAGGLALEVPLAAAVALRVAAQAGLGFGNPMSASETTEQYRPITLWRRSIRLGAIWQP